MLMPEYKARNAILHRMGFRSYKAYLKSPLWASIRKRVLERDNETCGNCGRRAWQVHHTRYTEAVLRGDDLLYCESVCGKCHRRAEFSKRGKKQSLAVANRILRHKCIDCGKSFRIRCKRYQVPATVPSAIERMRCGPCHRATLPLKKKKRSRWDIKAQRIEDAGRAAARQNGSLLGFLIS